MHSVKEIQTALRQKLISASELMQTVIKRCNEFNHLNALISFDENYAIEQAQAADLLLQNNQANALTGIPMAHKDLFCTHHYPTTCGSKMLANFQSPYQSTMVQKLQDVGAICIGKTNMDEFAMGSANKHSFFGPVLNPWDITRVPGGSSGGSAAAVASGLVPFATGSDTGGSIRQPAAFCGISGIKPTYGLVSRFGMVAYASSLDQAGPMARSAEDLAIILQAMAGHDPKDSTSATHPIPDYSATLHQSIKGLSIGIPKMAFMQDLDPNIQLALDATIAELTKAGARCVEVEFKYQSYWIPCYYVIACAEASSNLSRYDGIRFGYQSPNQSTLHDLITASRTEGFGDEVKRRILTGTYVLYSGYYDDYYLQALKIRRLIRDEFLKAFQSVDILLTPTTPTCAFPLNETITNPIQHYLADLFTVAANLAGLPALSMPGGFSKGLPIGIQCIGQYFKENQLLNLAHQFQQRTNWHLKTPPIGEKLS